MTHPALLTNRQVNLSDARNWYSALEYFRKFKSVTIVDFYNTTSSAGDWEGFIVQSINGHCYMILFSQENNYPRSGGYSVYTGENVIASWKGEMSRDDIDFMLDEYLREYERMYA